MGAFVAAGALIVLYVAWQANALMTTKAVEALGAEVTGLREQFENGGARRVAAAIDERVNEPGSGLYLLLDADGRRLAGNLPRLPGALAQDGKGHLFSYPRASGGKSPRERLAIGLSLSVAGGLTLVVARDIDDQRAFAAGIGRLALMSFGLLCALGVGAGILISRAMMARIEAITDTSRRIMAGDLSRRIPVGGSGDEMDRLAQSLNAMLVRIEELMAALREVSDNIAHDLKTPLNRLRNRAESALRSSDPVAYRDGLSRTIEEADELIKTFNSLLLIARLEAGAAAESMTSVDLADVIGDIAELYEPVAEEAGLRLAVVSKPGLGTVANRELVSQAVANLVDNAIKHCAAIGVPAAGAAPEPPAMPPPEIGIALARVGHVIEIAVSDHGPGIAPEDRERALQRFVRLEKSRSRPGAGLGLSLVAAVARMHGGSVRLEDNDPGLRAVLSIPIRSPGVAHTKAGQVFSET
ncbi:MAG: HAMP domain-containing protein [Hyphomicrobiaceae bacterium]|nr:HAMP domain-containing protein [Hyphomicrobiaceae bacterium]